MPRRDPAPRRTRILATATDLSSAEGLDRLSIGALASNLEMSKSGLFAHFGAKERLQGAVIEHAAEAFERRVLEPAAAAPAGLPRLRALVEHWIAHVEGSEYRGGCFFDASSSEFASRPGPIRDQLARLCGAWLAALEEQAELAIRLGELEACVDPALLTFRLHAYVREANWSHQLRDDPDAFERARAAVAAVIDAGTTSPTPAPEEPAS